MINVCFNCGTYCEAKNIEPFVEEAKESVAYAVCPNCGYKHLFRHLPLFIECGASGVGKTAVSRILIKEVVNFIPLEDDILWRPAFDKPEENCRDFFDLWLRIAKNINQAGRPVVLFSAGAGVPDNLHDCIELRYFSAIHMLTLVCSDATLAQRLHIRPSWRNADSVFIQTQLKFNGWYREIRPALDPPIRLLDTTHAQ